LSIQHTGQSGFWSTYRTLTPGETSTAPSRLLLEPPWGGRSGRDPPSGGSGHTPRGREGGGPGGSKGSVQRAGGGGLSPNSQRSLAPSSGDSTPARHFMNVDLPRASPLLGTPGMATMAMHTLLALPVLNHRWSNFFNCNTKISLGMMLQISTYAAIKNLISSY